MSLLAIDHVQLAIPSGGEAEARRFYGELLGLTEIPKPAALASRGGCWFKNETVEVHCGVEEPFRPARKAHIGFRVADVEAFAARAHAAGFAVSEDDGGLANVHRVFVFDPFGNRLEFLHSTETQT
ncbi:MAG TPA: VOC family protein [Caulobacteraceae bacterium]|jgi:catechol 2,3-dioxygenase-like lactoylglutathione lyase family enzyme